MTQKRLSTTPLIVVVMALLSAPTAFAQLTPAGGSASTRSVAAPVSPPSYTADLAALEIVAISRDADALPLEIEPQPSDPRLADSALVFTNMGHYWASVECIGYDKKGTPIGRTRTKVAPLGLSYVRASDISNSKRFLGQVQCKPRGRLVGSIVFLGPGITDLPVRNGKLGRSMILFPLVAHY